MTDIQLLTLNVWALEIASEAIISRECDLKYLVMAGLMTENYDVTINGWKTLEENESRLKYALPPKNIIYVDFKNKKIKQDLTDLSKFRI